MLSPLTTTKLNQLKLPAFIEVFNEMMNHPTMTLTLEESLTMMAEREMIARENRRVKRLHQAAKLRYPSANVANIDYRQARKFEGHSLNQLTHCQWVEKGQNVILVGAAGVGKSFIACALAHQACQLFYSVRYYRVARLIEILHLSHVDGSYTKLLDQLAKIQLLVLDDWGIDQLDRQARRDLLEVLEDRYAKSATIITTQLPTNNWHNFVGDDTIADAICDRVINNAYAITITGESMRKNKKLDS